MFTDSHTSAGAVTVHGNVAPQKSSLAPSLVGFQPTVASVVALLAAVHTHTQSSNPIQSTATQSRVKCCTLNTSMCAPVLQSRKMTTSCFTDNNKTILSHQFTITGPDRNKMESSSHKIRKRVQLNHFIIK